SLENLSQFRQNLMSAKALCAVKAAESESSHQPSITEHFPSGRTFTIHPSRYWTLDLDPKLASVYPTGPSVTDLQRAIAIIQASRLTLLLATKKLSGHQLW